MKQSFSIVMNFPYVVGALFYSTILINTVNGNCPQGIHLYLNISFPLSIKWTIRNNIFNCERCNIQLVSTAKVIIRRIIIWLYEVGPRLFLSYNKQ